MFFLIGKYLLIVVFSKYGELYAQTRVETLDALDRLKELNGLDDLKSKLLFSVIVVSTDRDRHRHRQT